MTNRAIIFIMLLCGCLTSFAQDIAVKYDFFLSYDQHSQHLVFDIPAYTQDSIEVFIDEESKRLSVIRGKAYIDFVASRAGELLPIKIGNSNLKLYHLSATKNGSGRIVHLPLWLSILPPLVAIALALLFKEVIISLFSEFGAVPLSQVVSGLSHRFTYCSLSCKS